MYLVRSSLIAYGLTRYVRLYRFNLFCIAISMTMDVLIISMMSLSNTFLYVCFHPLAYLVKLHIEMTMASLIAKIVKASSRSASCYCSCHGPRTDIPDEFDRQQQGRANKMAPTAGRFKSSWLLDKLGRNRGGVMIPALSGAENPMSPRESTRTEESRRSSRKSPLCTAGSISRRSEDLETGQPSTSDTSTIVPLPPSHTMETQKQPCIHDLHCLHHTE